MCNKYETLMFYIYTEDENMSNVHNRMTVIMATNLKIHTYSHGTQPAGGQLKFTALRTALGYSFNTQKRNLSVLSGGIFI